MDEYIDPKRTPGSRDQRQKPGRTWRGWIIDDYSACDRRSELFQQFQPLCANGKLEKRKSGNIPSWMRETSDESSADRIRDLT